MWLLSHVPHKKNLYSYTAFVNFRVQWPVQHLVTGLEADEILTVILDAKFRQTSWIKDFGELLFQREFFILCFFLAIHFNFTYL